MSLSTFAASWFRPETARGIPICLGTGMPISIVHDGTCNLVNCFPLRNASPSPVRHYLIVLKHAVLTPVCFTHFRRLCIPQTGLTIGMRQPSPAATYINGALESSIELADE